MRGRQVERGGTSIESLRRLCPRRDGAMRVADRDRVKHPPANLKGGDRESPLLELRDGLQTDADPPRRPQLIQPARVPPRLPPGADPPGPPDEAEAEVALDRVEGVGVRQDARRLPFLEGVGGDADGAGRPPPGCSPERTGAVGDGRPGSSERRKRPSGGGCRLESARSRLATERVKCDYAVCRLGVRGTCPRKRERRQCAACPLFDVCACSDGRRVQCNYDVDMLWFPCATYVSSGTSERRRPTAASTAFRSRRRRRCSSTTARC